MRRPDIRRKLEGGRRVVLVLLFLAVGVFGCASSRAGESDRIAELLGLEAGMRVADVGAGDGDWAVEMAGHVGAEGHVFATEVDEQEIGTIERKIASRGLDNMTAILGGQESTGLEEGCCDAILLRLVYHHFTRPEPMRASLRRALKPGGLIAVIDIVPQTHWGDLPGVPDRGGHGISADEVVADMLGAGFELVDQIDDWPGDDDHYCLLFRRPDDAG